MRFKRHPELVKLQLASATLPQCSPPDIRLSVQAVPTELKVVGAIMDALEGSNKVFLITSATGILGDVIGATEDAEIPDHPVAGRAAAEKLIAQVHPRKNPYQSAFLIHYCTANGPALVSSLPLQYILLISSLIHCILISQILCMSTSFCSSPKITYQCWKVIVSL